MLLKLTVVGELNQQLRPPHAPMGLLGRMKSAARRQLGTIALAAPGTHLVALTLAGADECRAVGARHVLVIPNGVDTDLYREPIGGRKLLNDAGITTFGYAGRLTAEKGTDTLAQVFRTVLTSMGGQVRFSVIGSSVLQLSPSSRLLGVLQRDFPQQVMVFDAMPNAAEFLRGIDCYVSASTYEGLPNAVLEAVACGLPCILSDIDAHREVRRLNPGAYVELFDPQDVDACVAAVQRLAGMRKRPASQLSQDLRMEDVASRYVAIYRSMVTGGA